MAANDEYVNSEGLNVKRREHPSEKMKKPIRRGSITARNEQQKTIVDRNREDGHGHGHGNEGNNRQHRYEHEPTSNRPQHSYLLDSVAQVMIETSKPKRKEELFVATSLHKANPPSSDKEMVGSQTPTRVSMFPVNNDDDDDDSVDSSDQGDDPILNMIQCSNGRFTRNQETKVPSVSAMQPGSSSKSKSKDPNRFLDDLDARLSQRPTSEYNQDEEFQQDQKQDQGQKRQEQSPQGNLMQAFVNTNNKIDWLRSVTTQDIQQSVSQLIPGMKQHQSHTSSAQYESLQISKQDQEYDSEDDEEKVHTVQSSALIGDHENAELMKIRQKMDMDLLTMGLEIVEKNRHYLWIVVTFCIMMFGYMLTKNRTVDGAI